MSTEAAARLRSVGHALSTTWRGVAWFLRGLSGEAKYDAYVAHERARHPERAPLSESEFWRDHYRRQDANPGSRCC